MDSKLGKTMGQAFFFQDFRKMKGAEISFFFRIAKKKRSMEIHNPTSFLIFFMVWIWTLERLFTP